MKKSPHLAPLRVVFFQPPLHTTQPHVTLALQPTPLRSVWCSAWRGCLFCCTTLAQSSPVATLAPLNPDIEFANAHTFFLRGQPPLIVSARLLVARAKRGVTLFVNPPPCRYCSAHSTHYVCCRPSFFGTTTSFVRFHSHRTAVSRQDPHSARHSVSLTLNFTPGAFPQS